MRKLSMIVGAMLITTAVATAAFAAGTSEPTSVNGETRLGQSARSIVTAVGDDWLMVTSADGTQTFQVGNGTHVIGRGLTAIARERQKTGNGATTLTDVINLNDHVVVSYKDVEGTLRANEVRVVARAK